MSRSLFEEIVALQRARRPFALATVIETRGSVPARAGAKMVVRDDGSIMGTVGGAQLEERTRQAASGILAEGGLRVFTFQLSDWKPGGLDSLCGGEVRIAVEAVRPAPHLLVAGGGHIGEAVYRMATALGWDVTVLDDRAPYVSADRFPAARARIQAGPSWFDEAELDFSHLLLVGYAHCNDTDILRRVLPRFGGYVGVVASRAKRERMWQRLRAVGVPEEALGRVEAPAGLDIGAEAPAEIALAIVAGIVQRERRGRAGRAPLEVPALAGGTAHADR